MSDHGHEHHHSHGEDHAHGDHVHEGHVHEHDQLLLENVTVCYRQVPAVHHVTATIECHALTALAGPNGAGKSTLLRAILGWHSLTTGSIRIGRTHSREALPRFAYLPQRTEVDWDFPATVRMVVEQGRYPVLGSFRRFQREDHAAVDAALAELGLESLQKRQIHELSGGQQQRVFLARALAQGADIFLLDEPYTGLDPQAREDLSNRLRTWRDQGRTVLAVVHDIDLAKNVFDHAVLLRSHLIAAGRSDTVFTPANIAAAFGTPMKDPGLREECHA